MTFNYQTATTEQLVEHLKTASSPSVSGLRAYYIKQNNKHMIDQIDLARKLLKIERAEKRLQQLKEEVNNAG